MSKDTLIYCGKLDNGIFVDAIINKKTRTFDEISIAGNIPHTKPTENEYQVTKENPKIKGSHYVLTISDSFEIRHHKYESFDKKLLLTSKDYYFISEQ